MNRTIDRLKIFFLGLFFVCCVAVWGYQELWVAPPKRCAAHGDWWDPDTRICATPIFLPHITGRPIGAPPLARPAARAEAKPKS